MAKTWKAVERAIAARLSGQRVGCTGRRTADVISDWLSVECKTRRKLPTWLLDAMRQAVANTWGDRLPLLILHQVGTKHDDDLVILRLADFERWVCPLFEPEQQKS